MSSGKQPPTIESIVLRGQRELGRKFGFGGCSLGTAKYVAAGTRRD